MLLYFRLLILPYFACLFTLLSPNDPFLLKSEVIISQHVPRELTVTLY